MNEVENTEASEINDKEPRIYEVGFHVVPTTPEEEVVSVSNAVKDLVESTKGAIIMDQNPSSVNLAYPMDHVVANKKNIYDSAYFGWVKFQVEPEAISTIKEGLEKNENIFRFLIIKTVREDTLARKPVLKPRKKITATAAAVGVGKRSEDKKEGISEEEVDKAIEELVVE